MFLLPKRYPFEMTLKAFWQTNLGEAKDQRLQLFEPKASSCNRLKRALDLSKTLFGSEKDFWATLRLDKKSPLKSAGIESLFVTGFPGQAGE